MSDVTTNSNNAIQSNREAWSRFTETIFPSRPAAAPVSDPSTSNTNTNGSPLRNVALPNRDAYLKNTIAEMRPLTGLTYEPPLSPNLSSNTGGIPYLPNQTVNSFSLNQQSGQVDSAMRMDTLNDPVARIIASFSGAAGIKPDGSPASSSLSSETQNFLNGYYNSAATSARQRILNSAGAGTRAFAELVAKMSDVADSRTMREYMVALDLIARKMGVPPNKDLVNQARNKLYATIANERERGMSSGENGIFSSLNTPGRTAGHLIGAALGGMAAASNPNQSFSGSIPGFAGPVTFGANTQRGGAWGNIMAGLGGFLRGLGQG